ncbi:hypothetical protein HDU96_010743 [Phlyctochytrium bullatum]|nr:hypothetical protein HDU96_010743 [Phlyctochytrium bullatum]
MTNETGVYLMYYDALAEDYSIASYVSSEASTRLGDLISVAADETGPQTSDVIAAFFFKGTSIQVKFADGTTKKLQGSGRTECLLVGRIEEKKGFAWAKVIHLVPETTKEYENTRFAVSLFLDEDDDIVLASSFADTLDLGIKNLKPPTSNGLTPFLLKISPESGKYITAAASDAKDASGHVELVVLVRRLRPTHSEDTFIIPPLLVHAIDMSNTVAISGSLGRTGSAKRTAWVKNLRISRIGDEFEIPSDGPSTTTQAPPVSPGEQKAGADEDADEGREAGESRGNPTGGILISVAIFGVVGAAGFFIYRRYRKDYVDRMTRAGLIPLQDIGSNESVDTLDESFTRIGDDSGGRSHFSGGRKYQPMESADDDLDTFDDNALFVAPSGALPASHSFGIGAGNQRTSGERVPMGSGSGAASKAPSFSIGGSSSRASSPVKAGSSSGRRLTGDDWEWHAAESGPGTESKGTGNAGKQSSDNKKDDDWEW